MNPEPAQQPRSSYPFRIFLLTFGVILALITYVQLQVLPAVRGVDASLREQNTRLDRIEASLALLHYSNLPDKSSEAAILDSIKYWSDQLAKYGYNRAMEPGIQEKLDLATQALKAIGKTAYVAVEKAFLGALTKGEDFESYRELLMDIAAELDKGEAKILAAEVLSNPGLRSNLRNHAARTLLKLDSLKAGLLLKEIILSESHTGMIKPSPIYLNKSFTKLPPGITPGRFQGYFNNINYLMQSSYPGKEDVLLTVLQQRGHDNSTYTAVVDGLMSEKSHRGAKLFQGYFTSGDKDFQNPLLRSKMAYGIVEILGKEACPWLRKAYTREADKRVRENLSGLIRDYCR